MRKSYNRIAKIFVDLFFTVSFLLSIFSCASTSGTVDTESLVGGIDTNALVGTWFWDFGFNQGQFSNEQLSLNKDGTIEIFHIQPEWTEWDKGDWSVIDDEKYGPTLVVHITGGKNKLEDEWDSVNAKLYFAIYKVTGDELFMGRYKRDFSEMGWGIQHYENPVANNYFRVKSGDVKKLEGTWVFNKRSIPGADQEETWTISADGKIDSQVKFADGKIVNLNGTYKVEKNRVLHISFDKLNGQSLPEAEEYWYEYNNVGENLINVNCLKYIRDGQEVTYKEKKVNFFYRDLPLVTYTYHIEGFTFNDYNPKASEYETLGLDKMYLFTGVPESLLKQELLGWYDNPELKGEPIKSISAANNTTNREFWAKWTLRNSRSEWNNSDGSLDHNYGTELPVDVVENFKIPSVGDTIKIHVYAKTSKELDGWGGPNFVDYSNDWKEFTENSWKSFKTHNKILNEIFTIKINDNLKTSDINQIGFRFGYDKNALDESCIFEEYKIEILDENSSKIIEYTFNYGGFEFKKLSVAGYPFYLPSNVSDFENVHWTLYNNTEIAGWYNNPEFKGSPIDLILADQNTKSRTFYGKPNLKFYPAEKHDDGSMYTNCQIFVKTVVPNAKINPKAGDVVKVALSATISKDYDGNIGIDLANNKDGYDFLGNDWHYVKTENKKLETFFEIRIEKDAQFRTIDDATFLLACCPETVGEVLILSDVKFEFTDKDPYVKPAGSTKHMKIEPCAEGFKFTLTKTPEDTNQWQWNIGVESNTENIPLYISMATDEIDKNGTVSFICPFVEKGKDYKFTFRGSGANGNWMSETLKVKAQNGKGELNYKALDPIQIWLESNSKEANLCAKNLTAKNIMSLVKNYEDDLVWVTYGCPIIAGKNDWSDTNYLFKASITVFPDFDENQIFYNDLLKNGKANILGDYNFWWGDAQKINTALSEKPTFWTRLDVNFKIKQNTDCAEFSVETHTTENTPYVPVKF